MDLSTEEVTDGVPDALEEAPLAGAEDFEGRAGGSEEGAQDPGHLRPDQSEEEDPGAEDGRHLRPEQPAVELLKRARGVAGSSGLSQPAAAAERRLGSLGRGRGYRGGTRRAGFGALGEE